MKIGLIHTTTNSMEPITEALNGIDDMIEIMNFLDEGLMYDIRNSDSIDDAMIKRIVDMVVKAEKSGADGILLACSAFSPYVEKLEKYVGIPLLSADMAMLEAVVDKGQKVGVLTTLEAARKTTLDLIEGIAENKGKAIEVEGKVVEKAFDSLKVGNKELHNNLILDEVDRYLEKYDLVVLAQMSMARSVQERGNNRIYTSPVISAKAIVERINKENRK